MFKMEYIAANVGSELEIGGDVFAEEEQQAGVGGAITLTRMPVAMTAGGNVYVYYKKVNDDAYAVLDLGAEAKKDVALPGAKEGELYCVKYLYTNDAARKVVINANFTPDTVSVILTANLYQGDANNVSTGTKVGTITIKVPRFLLSGSQEISMSMTGAANTPFEGSALATKGTGCDGDGIYAEIIEVIEGRTLDNLVAIAIEDEGEEAGVQLKADEVYALRVFGRYADTSPALLNNGSLTFKSSADGVATVANGVITAVSAGDAVITVGAGKVSASVNVKVTE